MDYRDYEIVRYLDGDFNTVIDSVVGETHFDVFLNGDFASHLMCTDKDLDYLVIGRLFHKGLITSASQIKGIKISGGRIDVEESGTYLSDAFFVPSAENTETQAVDYQTLFPAFKEFESLSVLFRKTGAIHNAAIWSEGKIICLFEDIGRLNNIDRIAGYILKNKIELKGKALFSSSRMPKEIVLKAAKLGFKTIIAVSAPTDLGIEVAKEYDIALIGMIRGKKFNIYNGFERFINR